MVQASEGERVVKLMLFIRETGPVSYADIRAGLSFEYGAETGNPESVRRRFERDKKTLQSFGVFLDVDAQQRYSLDATKSFALPLPLTKAQVSMLRLVCGALLEDRDYPFKGDLRMVLVKLGDELELPDMLPQMRNAASLAPAASGEPQGFAKIRKAISSRKRLSFEYVGSSGKTSTREVEPFGCFFLHSMCYVVAFDPDAQAERCFRADRMNKLRVHGANSDTPDFCERPFDASKYYGLPFQFGDELYTARLALDASSALRAQALAMGQGSFEQEGDEIVWTVSCRDAKALARWCIEHSPGIRILAPQEAAQAYANGLACFLACVDKQFEGADA